MRPIKSFYIYYIEKTFFFLYGMKQNEQSNNKIRKKFSFWLKRFQLYYGEATVILHKKSHKNKVSIRIIGVDTILSLYGIFFTSALAYSFQL